MRAKRTADLKHKLLWYVEHYWLPLATIRRHRMFLDHPHSLLMTLLNSRGKQADIHGLSDYLNARPKLGKQFADAPPPDLLV